MVSSRSMCGLSMLFRLLAGSLKCIIRPLTVVINNDTWGNADADAAMTMTPVIDINASSELPININDRDCQFIYYVATYVVRSSDPPELEKPKSSRGHLIVFAPRLMSFDRVQS